MRRGLLLILLLLLTLPVSAQVDDETPVEMIPFSSAPLNVQGLRPDGWLTQENSDGVFVRARDPLDLTAIIIQSQDNDKATFLASVTDSFGIEANLDPVETLETDFFIWDIYQFVRDQSGQELLVDMGIAEDEETGRIYYVLFQTNAVFYDDLHERVFIPAVTWLSPIQYYEGENFRVPVPVQWQADEIDDSFVQLSNQDESLVIYVATTASDDPILASQEFISVINPAFDETFDEESHALTLIEDPARIGALDAVYIIDWANTEEDEGFVLQSVARVYDGTVYMTVIVASVQAILENDTQVAFIDNGFSVTALEESAEATAEAQE